MTRAPVDLHYSDGHQRASWFVVAEAAVAVFAVFAFMALVSAAGLQTPAQFVGHKVAADNKLVRWDKAVEYFKLAAAGSEPGGLTR
jgi:hypothetical protein